MSIIIMMIGLKQNKKIHKQVKINKKLNKNNLVLQYHLINYLSNAIIYHLLRKFIKLYRKLVTKQDIIATTCKLKFTCMSPQDNYYIY